MWTDLILTILALLIVITIHECCHAIAANFFGDPTARLEGRISLNPLRHLDPMGLIMMFLVHIGWGKPVPVNPRYFKNPKREEALTALAGPVSNLVIALVLAVPVKYASVYIGPIITDFLGRILDISIVLFAFNILPFPPLDGSKFFAIFVPRKFELAYQRYLLNGTTYFSLFLLFDYFVLTRSFGFSILSLFIGKIFVLIKSIIFLGT